MENYRLTQTGEEVQEILNGAAMQQDLTAEVGRAEGAEQTLQGNIDEEERRAKAAEETLSGAIGDEELRAKAAEEALGGAIDGINAKIPAAASSENKLADQDFVNSSIETATATFRGTFNLVSDLHLAVDATHAQIATLLGTVIAEADKNDYSYVLIPTSAQTPTEIASIEKYTFGANGWAFAYALNNSGFTSAQWAAINSGITSGLVAKLNALPTNTDLLALLAGKQDVLTFDDVPVEGSNNPVKSGGVHSAIDDEKTARVNAVNGVAGRVDTIEGEIPAQASSENQLADKAYVNSSISTNTATYRGSFNLVADLGLSVSATHEQIGTALSGEISTADNNDYAYVQVPTSDETPSQILKVERYKFNGTAWAFEYELNNSGFTSAQWAALNSGITSGLVGKLNALPTNDELTLALAGKQDVLTFDNTPTENSNNPVKSGGVYAADKALSDAIEAILLLIPSAATSLNKLVDTDLMNSSISTATATFRGTFNLVSDLSLDLTATHAQIATALAGAIATADNNDYAFVQMPTAVGTPTEIAQTDRYKFNGTAWAYEYTLNTSGFTSAQWAAINSGITAALVASLADIPDLIPSEATSANQLADKAYVLAQILAATPAFKGQFVTLAELQAVASPKAGDLGIVRTKDSDGMDVFTVYQYLSNAWNVFYSLSYHPQTKPATTGTTGDYPYNGMGRVELAMNMVNTGTELAPVMVNQLTQDMFYKGAVGSRVPNTNTIFVIRYDYVLAENITIPDNCVLEFEGGSISGAYTFTGANTAIKADLVKIFDTTTTLSGTWDLDTFDIRWFGVVADDNTIDCTPIIEKIYPLNKKIHFPRGYFYLSALHVVNSNVDMFYIEGELGKTVYPATSFRPFTTTQSYIIKVGGSANKLDGNLNANRAYNINIINIGFQSDGSYNPTNLASEYNSSASYYFGALILDKVEGGHFAIYGSGLYNTPLLVIGYSYECHFDHITTYGHMVKNDMPLIYIINNSNSEISATYVEKMMCEVCFGPIIKTSELAGVSEFIIDQFIAEGTCTWNDDVYYTTEPDWSLYNKIPYFELYHNVDLIINHISFTTTNILWDNSLDMKENKNVRTLLKIGSLTSGSIKLLDVENGGQSKFQYIEGTGSNIYRNYVEINNNNNIQICYDSNINYIFVDYNQHFSNKPFNLIKNELYNDFKLYSLYNPADVNNVGVDSTLSRSMLTIGNSSYYQNINMVKSMPGGVEAFVLNKNGFIVDSDYIIVTIYSSYAGFNNWSKLRVTYYDSNGTALGSDSREDRYYGNTQYPFIFKINKSYAFSYIKVTYYTEGYVLTVLSIKATDDISDYVNTSGTFANKPSGNIVGVGFKYFCTDKQTAEGATDGIEIFHKGGGVWVDALGRTVS